VPIIWYEKGERKINAGNTFKSAIRLVGNRFKLAWLVVGLPFKSVWLAIGLSWRGLQKG
jgi:hypothetical protein